MILYVSSDGRMAGAEHSLPLLLRHLRGRIEPIVVCPAGSDLLTQCRDEGVACGRDGWADRLCTTALAAACIAMIASAASWVFGHEGWGFFESPYKYGTATAILCIVGIVHLASGQSHWAWLVAPATALAAITTITLACRGLRCRHLFVRQLQWCHQCLRPCPGTGIPHSSRPQLQRGSAIVSHVERLRLVVPWSGAPWLALETTYVLPVPTSHDVLVTPETCRAVKPMTRADARKQG